MFRHSERADVTMAALTMMQLLSTLTLITAMPQTSVQEVTVAAGERMSLECSLETDITNVVIWKKSDRVLYAGNVRVRHDRRITVDTEARLLVIEAVTPEDEGYYSCEVEDRRGRVQALTQLVTVLQPALVSISQVGEYLAVKQGTNLALNCVASGVPVPEVRWRKGPRVLSRGFGEAGVLLEYVTREDAGDLICEADNGIGDIAEDILALDVLFAPEVQMLEPHISFQPKCGLELQCVVHSSSEPRVAWMRDGLLLQPTEGVTIWSLDNLHVLQISRCDSEALGRYSCRAENNLGGGSAQTEVSPVLLETELQKFQEEEERVNNVRRNVEIESQESLPFKSSSIKSYLSFYSITFLLIILRLP